MSKKLLFAAIASILTLNAFADSKTITTQGYVDAQDALKQDLIDADMMEFDVNYDGDIFHYSIPSVASYDGNGLAAGEYGVIDGASIANVEGGMDTLYFSDDDGAYSAVSDKIIPTMRVVANEDKYIMDRFNYYQGKIKAFGVCNGGNPCADGNGNYNGDWLNSANKGSGIVTTTELSGYPGQRKIIEESDVPNYQASNLTANQKEIQKISIPTMGAVMAAISNNQVTLPTGTANSIVMYNANGNIGGSRTIATSVGTNTSATTIPTTGAVVTGLNSKQNKMTCTRYVENAEQTDANCLLWSIN